jgi:DNA-binding Lrp family transcriptional regulator
MMVSRGKVGRTLQELRRMDEFQAISVVTGHCDIIGIAEVSDMDSLTRLVADKIQALEGIIRTETLVCLPVQ